MPDNCVFVQYSGEEIYGMISTTNEAISESGHIRIRLEAAIDNYNALNGLVNLMRQEAQEKHYLACLNRYRVMYRTLKIIYDFLIRLFVFDVNDEGSVYFEVNCYNEDVTIENLVIGTPPEGSVNMELLNDEIIRSMGILMAVNFKFYVIIGKPSLGSSSWVTPLFKLLMKNTVISNHTNYLVQFAIAKLCGKNYLNWILKKLAE